MSLAGLTTFKRNLDLLTASEAFKNASDKERMEMGWCLLNSRYGKGSWCGFGPVHDLKKELEKK